MKNAVLVLIQIYMETKHLATNKPISTVAIKTTV